MAQEFTWADLKKTAEDAGFVTIPKGIYDAVVSKSTYQKNDKGKDQFKVVFKILTGPMAGKTLPNTFTISPDSAIALGFFFRHMAALGLNDTYFKQNPKKEKVANDLLGRTCQIEVEMETYNEQERSKIKNVKPAAAGVSASVGASVPSAVPQPMTAQPQPTTQPQPVAQPTAPAQDAEEVQDTVPQATPPSLPFQDDDDLPF
jgi:hypothetical protein